ncbi:insulin-like 3 (Leydig cell) [Misgurnus anguillicaudatus]|uniref:insulin-like 3 (Leydig cell) n=1 Tax=Misgurnus anguillicaudatus TaxID=75329 RepID=UPI0024357644|nr:insulin-like 3 (Leydig cell) [Misgurnus anguillicaudatus]
MNCKWFASLAFLILLESSKIESQDVRVKLCGREFIRMVVTSCGSSRLKRDAPDFGPLYTKPHRRLQNWLNRDLLANQKWAQTSQEEQWKESESPESVTDHPAPQQHMSPQAEVLVHSTAAQDLSMSYRTRRDVGPAGVCCTSGCTMSELIQYC